MKNITPAGKGLITGLTMIALAVFFYYGLKQPFESPYQYAIYTTYTIGIIWSILTFSKTADVNTKFKEYFSIGFKTFIVVTLLMVVFVIAFFLLNPQIAEAKIALNNELAVKEGNHTPIEIEANAKQMKSIFIPMMSAITTFMYLFLGALISAVTSGVIMQMKKQ
ncbi:DUF4199 domain-containing protein [Ferruginibacter sp. SUN002]|uniref:DUF4199 domain-containing protein n=1 Tax=Ferruginibacter sp. SUN002 TaxID=2937789 RepID=UPI003D360B65